MSTRFIDRRIHPLLQHGLVLSVLELLIYGPIILPLSTDDPHLVLIHVCSSWRKIALSTPSFWDNFVFLALPFNNTDHQLEAYAPSFNGVGLIDSAFVSLHPLTSIISNMGPIFGGDLIYGSGRISLLDQIILPNLGRLKSLDCLLSIEDNSDSINTHTPSRGTICQIKNCVRYMTFRLPWALMMKIDLGSSIISPNIFTTIMRLARNSLVDVHLNVLIDAEQPTLPEDHNAAPIRMHALSKLRLRLEDINESDYHRFLLLFHLPVLEGLWLELGSRSSLVQWDTALLAEWLSRTSNLQTLMLTDCPVATNEAAPIHHRSNRPVTSLENLQDLLRTTPNLRTLWLPTSIHVHMPIITDIASGNLLPHLDFFRFATDVDPNVIFDKIKRRNDLRSITECSTITSLNLTVPWAPLDVQNGLQIKANGLKLSKGCELRERLLLITYGVHILKSLAVVLSN
ncbi:hypothetical protein CPB84DRAFT_1750745 [Gymnopilus junonius]|uniref:F-box domain-containing protein n=1 Tax=Gymnopilus junonius TaxID=109634 RepID=A0A9P5NE32_GYMJU|nr:hypothetical protein CPB84DRAFT_1750745 [Gymnopilus junonius]